TETLTNRDNHNYDDVMDFYLMDNGPNVTGYVNKGFDVHLDDFYNNLTADKKSSFFLTALHESQHTMGLQHPFESGFDEWVHNSKIDSTGSSIMSYNERDFNGNNDLRIYDLAVLHYRYGVNPNARSGDDTYGFKNFEQNNADGGVYIWDGAGVDTFDASNEKDGNGVYVNLTAGSRIYRGGNTIPNWTNKHLGLQEINGS
ncbi:MAG: hypothetical protein KGV46_03035, partial [Pasteurella sp.]|nr:hypothetical protein [Pasteurella sp.]